MDDIKVEVMSYGVVPRGQREIAVLPVPDGRSGRDIEVIELHDALSQGPECEAPIASRSSIQATYGHAGIELANELYLLTAYQRIVVESEHDQTLDHAASAALDARSAW